MGRKTKEEIKLERREKNIQALISKTKWLYDPKFYDTNFWSMAHWQSWAVQGKDGGCCACHEKYYSGSLCNTRRKTRRGGGDEHCRHIVDRLCHTCITLIETKINCSFKRSYAP